MPKMKTVKSIAKRFKVTKTGKVLPYGSSNSSHIMSKKNSKRRRRLRHPTAVKGAQAATMRRLSGK